MPVIVTQNGNVGFDSPKIHFSRGMTLANFRTLSVFPLFTLSRDLDSSLTYDFGPVHGDGIAYSGAVWFYSAVILKLSLEVIQPPRPGGDEYYHRNHLHEIPGHRTQDRHGNVEYSFAWGRICVGEMKGIESDIWIHYTT
jgi:hypothetical protein